MAVRAIPRLKTLNAKDAERAARIMVDVEGERGNTELPSSGWASNITLAFFGQTRMRTAQSGHCHLDNDRPTGCM